MSKRLNSNITTSPGFQYSINVKYDLKSLTKVANYIPLAQTTSVITDVITSNKESGTFRSRLIVGNYGTGKSHLSVVLLSIMGKVLSIEAYSELLLKIKEYDPEAAKTISSELSEGKMLPVVVTGSDQPFEQMLLTSLQSALEEAGLNSLMPSTSYSATLEQIGIWEGQYPEAYASLTQYLLERDINISKLIEGLESCNKTDYNIFTSAYNYVTHGAVFQPLLQGKVEDIYLEVARQMSQETLKGNSGFKGIFVLFDEFGKYLETAWENKETVNLQPLQEFAEACNSSAEHPIQFILVTHKPIAQYASKYGQDLVNEWKKVEGRFKTIELVNQPTKIYEIISNVILKDKIYWKSYQDDNKLRINELRTQLINTRLFSDLPTPQELDKYILNGSFPLHPVLVFALPRFSQKVAQNERTVFTFLCSNEFNTLNEYLNKNDADLQMLLTLDILYDYFENQMRTIDNQDNIHTIWFQTNAALSRLDENELVEAKILKSISVIKAIGLPTVLPATIDILKLTYSGSDIDIEKLVKSFQTLLRKRILFEGSTTGVLEFIVPGEMDIEQELSVLVVKRRTLVDPWSVLNGAFLPNTVLAKRYNDKYSMVRYFSCLYVSVNNIANLVNDFEGHYGKDGLILYVLREGEGDIDKFKHILTQFSAERIVFVVNENYDTDYKELETLIRKLDALKELLKVVESGKHLEADRLEILLRFKDAETEINFILSRTFNLKKASIYYCKKKEIYVNGKSALSRFISDLCVTYFNETPKFNNEMINKHNITAPIINARKKVVNGLLSQYIVPKLGIIGSGPELAIFKCLLAYPGIVVEEEQSLVLSDLKTLKDKDEGLSSTLLKLKSLLTGAIEGLSVYQILEVMCNPPYGVRLGVIPILLAIVLREQKKEVLLLDSKGKEFPLNAENIDNALKEPKGYLLLKENWSQEKTLMCHDLEILFKEYMDEDSSLSGPTKQIADAFRRWLFSIPRFTRDSKGLTQGAKTLRKLLKSENLTSTKLIFREIPDLFGVQSLTCVNEVTTVISRLSTLKDEIDGYLSATIVNLEQDLVRSVELGTINSPSLLASLKTWYELLPPQKRNNLYSDGTQNLIDLVSSFSSENSIDFSNRLFISLTGLRPEDWNDQTVKGVPQILKDMLYEVASFEYVVRQEGDISASTEVEITFPQDNGTSVKRIFSKGSVSQTGNLLQNVLWSYITEYGDSVTNNEKRQIVLTILEKLVKS